MVKSLIEDKKSSGEDWVFREKIISDIIFILCVLFNLQQPLASSQRHKPLNSMHGVGCVALED